MIKNILAFLFFILITCLAQASETDSTFGKWSLQSRADFGFIIAHRPALVPLQEGHVKGFEITAQRQTIGTSDWENIFYYPSYGITTAFFDLGSPDHLGYGIAIYPFIDFPLSKRFGKGLHFRYGMGLGYIEKPFNAVTNIKNAAIGSHLNGVIHFDLHAEKAISKKSKLELGAGITHYSNGSYELPNLGINIATVNLAYHHSFGDNLAIKKREVPKSDNRLQVHIYAGGFLKKVYPPNGKRFFAGTLSGMLFKQVNPKSAWGLGTDLFYDKSLSYRIDKLEAGNTSSLNNFRPGIYGAYHLSIKHLGLMFNMGYYLYTKWKGDGNVYHRICIRYYFDKTFLCVNLKTHYAKADFIEMGVGVRIGKK